MEIKMKNIKVGDYVSFKYDVEQTGPIVKIEYRRDLGETVYTVLATRGEYVRNRNVGVHVQLGEDEIW
jgi:hypothetical protein